MPEIMQRVARNELSGSLEASSGQVVRTIYFDRGFVVFTASNSKKDRLGQCLLEAGKITEHELETATNLMKGRRRIGQAIVQAGLLNEDELGRALARQAHRIATSIYAFQQGMYRLEEKACPIPLELRLGLSMYRLQLEGIRKMKNRALIIQTLPPVQEVVRLSKCPPFTFEDVQFEPIELLVMEAGQKERSIQAIVGRVGRAHDDTLRTIYGLLCAGILERASADQTAPLKVQEETGTFLLSPLDRQEGDKEAENVRQEVLLEFESSEHASPDKLLEVNSDAGEVDIRGAYAERIRRWDEKKKELENESTLCVKVDEIKRRLERAKAELLKTRAPEPAPEPAPKRKDSKGNASTPDTNAEIKRLFREIKLHKMVNDDEGVISLLYELVHLQPDNAKYEALLAQALGSHDVMKKKAERHFRRALSLDPQNAEFHYFLGRYYQSFDMRSRALAEFKSALRIDPKLSKARSALVELKGDDGSFQDRLKGLFS